MTSYVTVSSTRVPYCIYLSYICFRTWSGVRLSSSPMAIGSSGGQASASSPSEAMSVSPFSSPGKCFSFSPPKKGNGGGGGGGGGSGSGAGPPKVISRPRGSRLWTETVAHKAILRNLPEREIQRQEAMFELFQGEEDMVEDLKLVKTAYYDSLRHLNLMTDKELQDIFGSLHTLVPLHEELVDRMLKLRNDDGTTDSIGQLLIDWVPGLSQYIGYCANQVLARALLDEKKNHDKRLDDFLLRCIESPFSRKLDLWNFLDVPRSRLVKYPLLFKNILKLTPENHPDSKHLIEAISIVEDIIHRVDDMAGEAECQIVVGRLDYLDDKQRDCQIESASTLLYSGVLRNTRGTKLNVFLFNHVLVLTRPATRDHGLCYQVYRQPIPAYQLVVEDLKDGEVKMGSFRNAFSHNQTARNLFRVSFRDQSLGQSHTLQAHDSHEKKQWLHKLLKVSQCPPILPSPVLPSAAAILSSSSAITALLSATCQVHNRSSSSHNRSYTLNTSVSSGSIPSLPSVENGECSCSLTGINGTVGSTTTTVVTTSHMSARRLLRKRSSDNSLQVQSTETSYRVSSTTITTNTQEPSGRPPPHRPNNSLKITPPP
ncbi:Rho guanine nucleotide exchange factor 3 [Chamberlinius hualienensis]